MFVALYIELLFRAAVDVSMDGQRLFVRLSHAKNAQEKDPQGAFLVPSERCSIEEQSI
jgi:hypothetical protein